MTMTYITRRATFSASHRLHVASLSDEDNRRIFRKCNSPNGHGHNYVLEVTVKGNIDPVTGLVMDFTDLKAAIKDTILDQVDHKYLNLDVPIFKDLNPTAENMAVVFWNWLDHVLPAGMLHEIKLWETENCWAVYRGPESIAPGSIDFDSDRASVP